MAGNAKIAAVAAKVAKPLMMAVSGATALSGFAPGASPLMVLVGAVAGNVLSDQLGDVSRTFQEFLRRDGRVNHDLQRALASAFEKALTYMERRYLENDRWRLRPDALTSDALAEASLPDTIREALSDLVPRNDVRDVSRDFLDKEALRREIVMRLGRTPAAENQADRLLNALTPIPANDCMEPPQRERIHHLFAALKNPKIGDFEDYFLDFSNVDMDAVLKAHEPEQAFRLLAQGAKVDKLLKLDAADYGEHFVRFFCNELPGQVQLWFYEILKQDNPESTKAWRAYQRLMTDFLRENLHKIYDAQQAGFVRISKQLQQIQARLDSLPEKERLADKNEPFLLAVQTIADTLRSELHVRFEEIEERLHHIEDELREQGVTIERIDATTQETLDVSRETRQTTQETLDEVKQGSRISQKTLDVSEQTNQTAQEIREEIKQGSRTAQEIQAEMRTSVHRLESLIVQNSAQRMQSVETIFVDVKKRFQNLIARHTGLFAGREEELRQIEEFLATRSKGYVFVTAPSGYGKTALLANLVAQQEPRFCYHFISQRDAGTVPEASLLKSLCAQIFRFYSINLGIPVETNSLQSVYGEVISMSARDPKRPLLVVIDGVDEADYVSDLHIPCKLPEGTFIIFSGRRQAGRDYVAEFGLPSDQVLPLELTGLDANGIRCLLQQAGDRAAALVADDGFVCQLREISGGDPFYARFLIQDIQDGKITPDTLAHTPRSLEIYLDQQFAQLQASLRPENRNHQKTLIGLLLAAKDRLSRNDLMRLTGVDDFDIDTVMQPLTRFLIGDADGYTLCHPRFADHFRTKLDQTVATCAAQLLEDCGTWAQHDSPSPYALRYYAVHLLETPKRHDDLFALARNAAFRQAQLDAFPHDPDLCLDTIQAALHAASERDDAVKMAEFLLAHAYQVLDLQASDNPLGSLRRADNLARSWELADLCGPEQRIKWYLLLAWELHDTQRDADARNTLERLLEKPLPGVWDWLGEVLISLLMQAYDLDEEAFWHICEQTFLSSACYVSICDEFLKHHNLDAATQAAIRISDGAEQAEQLRRIAEELAKNEDTTKALEICMAARNAIERIGDIEQKITACQKLAMTQFELDDRQRARETLVMAAHVTQQLDEADERVNSLFTIVNAQIKIGDKNGTHQTLAAMKEAVLRVRFVCRSVQKKEHTSSDDLHSVTPSLEATASYHVKWLSEIAMFYAAIDDCDGAKDTLAIAENAVQHITDPKDCALALGQLVFAYVKAGDWDKAKENIKQVTTIVRTRESAWSGIEALATIAMKLAEAGDAGFAQELLTMALAATQKIDDSKKFQKIFLQTRKRLWSKWPNPNFFTHNLNRLMNIIDKVQQVENAFQKAKALGKIAGVQVFFCDMQGAQETLGEASIANHIAILQSWGSILDDEVFEKQKEFIEQQVNVRTVNDAVNFLQWFGDYLLPIICSAQLRSSDITGALLTTQSISSTSRIWGDEELSYTQLEALKEIVSYPLTVENERVAQGILQTFLKKWEDIDKYEDKHEKKNPWGDVVDYNYVPYRKALIIQAELGDISGALVTAQRIGRTRPCTAITILEGIASVQKKLGDNDGMEKTIEAASAMAVKAYRKNEFFDATIDILTDIAKLQVRTGDRATLPNIQKILSPFLGSTSLSPTRMSAMKEDVLKEITLILKEQNEKRSNYSTIFRNNSVIWSRFEYIGNSGRLNKTFTTEWDVLCKWAFVHARQGRVERALDINKIITSERNRIEFLWEVALILMQTGDEKRAKEILDIAQKRICRDHLTLARRLSRLLSPIRLWTSVRSSIPQQSFKLALEKFIKRKQQQQEEALIENWRGDRVVIEARPENYPLRDFRRGVMTLFSFNPPTMLAEMAKIQIQRGDIDNVQDMLKMALVIAEHFSSTVGLLNIAIIQAEMGDINKAKATVKVFNSLREIHYYVWVKALGMIAAAQVRQRDVEGAKATVREVEEEWRYFPLYEVAKALAEVGDVQEALMTAQEIDDLEVRVKAYAHIAMLQAHAGDADGAATSFATAVSLAQTPEFDSQKADLLYAIAEYQARSDYADEALRTAMQLPFIPYRNLLDLAAVFAERNDREHFKALLRPCAAHIEAAYAVCGHLARLYPEQAAGIAAVVQKSGRPGEASENSAPAT